MRSNSALKAGDRALGCCGFALLRAHNALRRLLSPSYRDGGPPAGPVRSIAVIKLCCLGDGILAVPAIRALKHRWPEARITVLCTPRSGPAFANLPFIDELISLPVTGLGDTWTALRRASDLMRAIGRLRALKPEVAVDLDLYFKATPVMAYLTGAPVRVGFDTAGYDRAGLYTLSVPRERDRWEAECFLQVVGTLGVPTDDLRLEFAITPTVRTQADQILRSAGLDYADSFVAVCPGSSKNWPSKQWPSHRFAEVIDWLWNDRGMRSVLIGAGFEVGLCEEVARLASAQVDVLAGETTVTETAAILERAAALVTNDTGPLHLASAVGTPVIAIFGPTNEKKWGPRGPRDVVIRNEECDCRPCYYLSYMPDCEHRRCLEGIPAARVIDAVRGVLASG